MRIARPLILVMLFGVSALVAAEPVFDNLDGPHDGGGWWNKDPEDLTAQPFQLGNHTTVNSVSLRLDPRGQPDDTLYLNLYNDDAGKPGTLVGSLGTLDSLTVANGGAGIYHFDTPVSGLTPEATYHLVLSHDGTNWNDPSPRIFWRMTSQTGAAGAGQALAIEPNFCVTEWHAAHNYPCGGPPFPVWFFASVDAPLRGDFDGDGSFTSADIDTLTTEIVAGPPNDPDFDLSNDSRLDSQDLRTWLSNAGQHNGRSHEYRAGDSNLDGSVDAADLNNLALNWQQDMTLWSGGDFTADGVVNSSDLNELAVNWRTFVPFAGAAVIKAGSDTYVQTFDEALGTDGGVTGTNLPTGWTVTDNGSVSDTTMRPFPIGATMSGSGAATFNAGAENDPDRALAIGVSGREDDLALRLLAHTTVADAESFQLHFDVEAWDAVDGIRIGETVIAGPDDPGEAAFKLTVDIDSGDGFTSLLDLGTVTTGSTLQPVFEGIVDGNTNANRISFDSGIVSASIPADSKLRFSWAPDFDAQTNGWVFGIDNVSLQLFTAGSTAIPASVPEPSGLLLMVTGLALAWRRPSRS